TAAGDALLRSIIKSSPKKEIQGACIRALGVRRSTTSIEELVEILAAHDADRDRLFLDAREALWEITGYDRATGKAWRQLFQEQGKALLGGARGSDKPWVFTLPEPLKNDRSLPGNKVVIAIDTSGSLHVRDPGKDDPPFQGEKPKVCPDCGRMHPGSFTAPKSRALLEREKVAVSLILSGLRAKTKFQLVRFDTTARGLNVRGE